MAKAIHEDYIAKRKKRNEPIKVAEKFEDLDDSARYSNLRQAMNISKKLQKVGYMLPRSGFRRRSGSAAR